MLLFEYSSLMLSGGAIGAGYFVATGSVLATGGPGSLVWLAY